MDKKQSRRRRGQRARARILESAEYRLCIHRTPRHIYAQLIVTEENRILASASTVEKEIKKDLRTTGNINAAVAIGKLIAQRAQNKGVKKVAFDRSGFKYHGRIKALADAAREGGLEF